MKRKGTPPEYPVPWQEGWLGAGKMQKMSRSKSLYALLAAMLLALSFAASAGPKIDKSFIKNGKKIHRIIIDGRPPEHFRAPAAIIPKTSAATEVVALASVPAFDWSYGCSATAAAMMMGYYDNVAYTNMYAGPTNSGLCPMNNSTWGPGECPLSATHMGKDNRLIKGHVDDYWVEYGSSAPDPFINYWTEHAHGDCLGDFMGTNQANLGNTDGATTFYFYEDGAPLYDYADTGPFARDGCHGLRLFAESRGYELAAYSNFSQFIQGYNGNAQGFAFTDYQAEIDAGRPVLIQVEGHTMLGFGYDSATQTVFLHDTWDYLDHQMTWGGSYSGMQHYGVTVFRLQCALSIDVQPSSVAVCAGESVTFGIKASGAGLLSYQWRRNSLPINGATAPSYTVPSVDTTNTGSYDCVVSNDCGSVTSKPAVLALNQPASIWAEPTNQSAVIGSTATFSVGAYGKDLTYQWQMSSNGSLFTNVTNGTGGTTSTYTTPAVGAFDDAKQFRCIVSGVCPPSVISVPATLTVVVSDAILSESFEAPFMNGAPPGWSKQYLIGDLDWQRRIGDHTGGTAAHGTYNAMLYTSSMYDHKTYLITPQLSFASCNQTARLEFWYKMGAAGSQQDTLTVYVKTDPTRPWQTLANYTRGVTTWTKQTHWLPSLSSDYRIAFCANAKGGNGVCIDNVVVTQDCCPGYIDAQPVPAEACAGSTVTFTVKASGIGLNYRWRKNGVQIASGPTGSGSTYAGTATRTLWIINAEPGDAASAENGYDCLVFNACSSLTSERVSLGVTHVPSIATQSPDQMVPAGRVATFSVSAAGGESMNYQWSKDGQIIIGATGPSHTVPSASPTDAGSYDCVVWNACGVVKSDAALLVVVPLSPTIADARSLSDSLPAALDHKVVTFADTDFFYIEDENRACGIRVDRTAHGFVVGDRVDIVGHLATDVNNEHYVQAVAAVKNGHGKIGPLGIGTSYIGGNDWIYDPVTHTGQRGTDCSAPGANNVGLLVRTFGRLCRLDATTFTLDDGSGTQVRCVARPGTLIDSNWQYACVTGVVSIYRLNNSVFPPQVLVDTVQGW